MRRTETPNRVSIPASMSPVGPAPTTSASGSGIATVMIHRRGRAELSRSYRYGFEGKRYPRERIGRARECYSTAVPTPHGTPDRKVSEPGKEGFVDTVAATF